MSETPSIAKIRAVCPNCGHAYVLSAEFVGRHAKCKQCEQTFTVSQAPAADGAHGASPQGGILCPVCQSGLSEGDPQHACPECKSLHHKDCWDYNKGCGLYGCKEAPPTDKLQEIEIPASFWGQTEKKCPHCGNQIQAAAVRCRHCGTEFKTARPTESHEFRSQQMVKHSLPFHRKFAVILLAAAVIPCTAPVAAIVGLIWYFAARKNIEALPTLQVTIARIAVALAIVVTIVMVVIGMIYASFN